MMSFRILGVPVGVHLTFLFVALLGASAYRGFDIAIWTAAAFVSILSHELGHALVARAFGARNVNVTLYGLGGLTSYQHGRAMTHGRSFLVSAAGSAVGIVLGGGLWLMIREGVFDGSSHEVAVFVDSFVYTALVWGILNWVPIVPLDGGHMVLHLASMVSERSGPLIAQVVTWCAVAIVVPIAWVNDYPFAALIVVFFAFMGLREFRDAQPRRPVDRDPADDAGEGQKAPDAESPPSASTPRNEPPEFPI